MIKNKFYIFCLDYYGPMLFIFYKKIIMIKIQIPVHIKCTGHIVLGL